MDRFVKRYPDAASAAAASASAPGDSASAASAPAKRARTEPPAVGRSPLRLVIIADTHNEFDAMPPANMPPGDVLVHCGDWDSSTKLTAWLRSLNGMYAHVLLIHGNHDEMHREISPQRFEGEGPASKQSRPPLTLELARRCWRPGTVAPNYAAALAASERLQRAVKREGSRVPRSEGCILCDSGVVINGWTIWGTPWHAPSYNEHPLFTADEDTLRHIYSHIPPTADIVLTHGPAHDALDRPAKSFVKKDGFYRDLESGRARECWRKKRLGSRALKERLGDLRVKLHACGHVHARQSALDPDVRHLAVGETLHVNAAVMQTLPGVHWQVGAALQALRAPVVVELTEADGARVVTEAGHGAAGGAGPSGA